MAGKTLGVADSEPTFDALTVTGATTLTGAVTATGNVKLGDATTDTIGFYNATAVTQPTSASQAAVATAAAITAGGAYGFANAAQANALVTLVNQIRSDLVTLGLLKGS